MAENLRNRETASSRKVLKTIINSADSSDTAKIQATRALAVLGAKDPKSSQKALGRMTRGEITSELRRLQALTGGIPL